MKSKLKALTNFFRWHKYHCTCGFKSNSPSEAMAHYGSYTLHNFPIDFDFGKRA